jgi:hypothetical protein
MRKFIPGYASQQRSSLPPLHPERITLSAVNARIKLNVLSALPIYLYSSLNPFLPNAQFAQPPHNQHPGWLLFTFKTGF